MTRGSVAAVRTRAPYPSVPSPALSRRQFLGIGGTGLVVLSAGSLSLPRVLGSVDVAQAAEVVELTVSDAFVEMYDLRPAYMWLFGDSTGPKFPGPVIMARQGDVLTVRLRNLLDEGHAFAVAGTGIRSATVEPGGSATVTFTVPAPGTYLYHDPLNAPVNRVLGLHGALVVLPASGNTPYALPSAGVRRLFADLGTTAHFPGLPWAVERTRVWVVTGVDPRWNRMAERGEPIDPTLVRREWLARYFMINGKSGLFCSHAEDVMMSDFLGRPYLVRIVNAGLNTHSLHLHGNHFYVLAVNGVVQRNVQWLDSFTHAPLSRIDWLHPFVRPPDVPGPVSVPLRDAAREELAYRDSYGLRQRPLSYPMHCHTEMSQVAAGGNYPGGLVTHWEIIGDLDGVPF